MYKMTPRSVKTCASCGFLRGPYAHPSPGAVGGDRFDELRFRAEADLVAEPLPQLDHEPLPVEIGVEVEQMRLGAPLGAAGGRVGADRDRRRVAEGRAGVDAQLRDEDAGRSLQICRRKAEQ